MRVIAFAKYGDMAASTRQRLLQYLPYLGEHGVSVDVFPLLDNDHVERLARGRRPNLPRIIASYARRFRQLRRASRYDLIWVHYELFPYLPGRLEALVARAGKPVVVDFDDATFHLYDQNKRKLVRTALGDKLAPLLRAASACVCGNAYLQDYAKRYCENSIVIPTVVDTREYTPRPHRERGRTTVGWIGSPSTWLFLKPLLPVLLPFLQSRGAVLRVVGAGSDARGIEGIEAVDWSEETEIAEVQNMDIGIMPLPDEPWARGKCGYKLIQYMACGLPVVASPVGVNSRLIAEGENGFLATGDAEWTEALDRLLSSPELRTRMGRRGRELAERHYSLSSQEPIFLDVLQSAFAGRRAIRQQDARE